MPPKFPGGSDKFEPGIPFQKKFSKEEFLKGDIRKERRILPVEKPGLESKVVFSSLYPISAEENVEIQRKRKLFPPDHRWRVKAVENGLFTLEPFNLPGRDDRLANVKDFPLTEEEKAREKIFKEGLPGVNPQKLLLIVANMKK